MSSGDYEYFARVSTAREDSVDRPSGLWRRCGDGLEYLSMVDWSWRRRTTESVPHPELLVPVSPEQVEVLLADRRRFARYWVERLSPEKGDLNEDTLVYRQLPSPEGVIDEGFGRTNTWVPTPTIRDFQANGPHDHPDLEPIDGETAERLIRETRGISGATEM
ncbi:hypothetical protein [Kribbella jiaozuonensis]|uniref:Uncharacterized protein n=1 Tax=Kribbella jiaozuonensis TaxID=2575441 RepID=A0A4U3LP47_9ACTN|nr:hypothetical protein [Kribbella jiaozuonensis]TKK77412.1 hypothetical protein FDA38_19785 [Kribbella jiaozuonensis]